MRDHRRLRVQQRPDLGVVATWSPALRVAPNATSSACRSVQLPGRRPREELGVLRHRAGLAALDEPDAQLVEEAGDGELVADGVVIPSHAGRRREVVS